MLRKPRLRIKELADRERANNDHVRRPTLRLCCSRSGKRGFYWYCRVRLESIRSHVNKSRRDLGMEQWPF